MVQELQRLSRGRVTILSNTDSCGSGDSGDSSSSSGGSNNSTSTTTSTTSSTSSSSSSTTISACPVCRVDILERDFLCVPWWGPADVVFSACTVFSDDVLHSIVSKCLLLRTGSLVVLLDRPALSELNTDFVLIGSFQGLTSWGESSVYVYSKI
jgi:hypothetical protein